MSDEELLAHVALLNHWNVYFPLANSIEEHMHGIGARVFDGSECESIEKIQQELERREKEKSE